MKSIFIFVLLTSVSSAWSARDWKVIAETVNCEEKFKIMAKEGEKFVYAVQGDKKIKLIPEDKSAFKVNPPRTTIYTNEGDKILDKKAKRLTFIQPSELEGNNPKLDVISLNGVKDHCRMKLKK